MSTCHCCGAEHGEIEVDEYIDLDILRDMTAALARGDNPAAAALLDIMFRDTLHASVISEHIARARASNAAKPKDINHV